MSDHRTSPFVSFLSSTDVMRDVCAPLLVISFSCRLPRDPSLSLSPSFFSSSFFLSFFLVLSLRLLRNAAAIGYRQARPCN